MEEDYDGDLEMKSKVIPGSVINRTMRRVECSVTYTGPAEMYCTECRYNFADTATPQPEPDSGSSSSSGSDVIEAPTS